MYSFFLFVILIHSFYQYHYFHSYIYLSKISGILSFLLPYLISFRVCFHIIVITVTIDLIPTFTCPKLTHTFLLSFLSYILFRFSSRSFNRLRSFFLFFFLSFSSFLFSGGEDKGRKQEFSLSSSCAVVGGEFCGGGGGEGERGGGKFDELERLGKEKREGGEKECLLNFG